MSIALVAYLATTHRAAYAADENPAANITVQDNRPEERKHRQHAAVYSPMLVFADDAFKPSALDRFREALRQARGGDATINLVVDDFAVIDYYPVRLGTTTRGPGLAAAFAGETIKETTDWKLVEELKIPKETEVVICIFAGSIDGKPVNAKAYSPYKASSLLVRRSTEFHKALDDAIHSVAAEVVKP